MSSKKKKNVTQKHKDTSEQIAFEDIDIPIEEEEAQYSTESADNSQRKQTSKAERKKNKHTTKRYRNTKKASVSFVPPKTSHQNDSSVIRKLRKFLYPKSRIVIQTWGIFVCLVIGILLINPVSGYVTHMWHSADNIQVKLKVAAQLLQTSVSQGEWEATSKYFNMLHTEFAKARTTFPSEQRLRGRLVGLVPIGSLLTQANSLLLSGKQLSEYSANITRTLTPLTKTNQGTILDSEQTAQNLVQTAQTLRANIPNIKDSVNNAHEDVRNLPAWAMPASISRHIQTAQKSLPEVNNVLTDARRYLDILLEFAGQDYKRKYLFVFQNNQEVRATGGFIGTYGLMKVYKGEVEHLDIQSIYDADGQLKENTIPPKPLQALTHRWNLRDANWFADFPTSANKIIQFYEQAGGPTVDGVIALTPPMVKDIVEVVGPIEMPKYNTTVTADKFVKIVQHKTSIAYDKEKNDPKAFINDLAPKLLQRMFKADKEKYQQLAEVIAKGAERKQLLLYAQENSIQKLLENYNLSGSVVNTRHDYLSVINSNIGGKKTDGVIEQNIEQTVSIQSNGEIISNVTIKRTHNGGNTKYARWNATNKNYMRVFVPKGSELIQANGFSDYEIPYDREYSGDFQTDSHLRNIAQSRTNISDSPLTQSDQHGKTVYEGWTITEPQNTTKVTLKYRLPFSFQESQQEFYSLIVQKQAGTPGSRYHLKIEYPDTYTIPWNKTSFDVTNRENVIESETILRTDEYYGGVFAP